jgi:hypothetical protein
VGFTGKETSLWFKSTMLEAGILHEKLFRPQQLRHLWVTSMKARQAASLYVPHMRGQAHAMGHDPEQWEAAIYNVLLKQLETQEAVDGMEEFLDEVVAEPATTGNTHAHAIHALQQQHTALQQQFVALQQQVAPLVEQN